MSAISDTIRELESRVDTRKIVLMRHGRRFEVYPWIKPYIFSRIQMGDKPESGKTSKSFQLFRLFNGLTNAFRRSKTVFFSTSLERRMLDDSVYDKLFHTLSTDPRLAPSRTSEMIIPGNYFKRSLYKDPRSSSRSFLLLLEMLYARLFLGKLNIEGLDQLEGFAKEYGLDHKQLIDPVKKFYAQYKLMKWWLRWNKSVQYIFLSVSYTNFGRVIACKEKNIPVIECQHGVIGSEHYAYSYFYEPETDQFPEYILVFGENDAEFINQGPLGRFMSAVPVGSFILDYYSKKTEQPSTITKVDQVAVSLQDCETGVGALTSFIELARMNPGIRFRFKRRNLSPEFYKGYEFPANVTFEEELNIYELIVDCDVHLTAYSSCALEAITLGRPNILFNLNNKAREYYSSKLEEGVYNAYCNTAEEMSAALRRIKIPDVRELIESNSRNFMTNYTRRIDDFIKQLLKNG